MLFTLGMTKPGAIEKSIGLVAASANDKIRATGLIPKDFALSIDDNNTAAAPSFKVEAFPAVIVPFSKKKF